MENYKEIIEKNNGIILASKLESYNMDRHILRNLVGNGLLVKIEHGIYAKPDKDVNEFWLLGEKYKNVHKT